MRSTGHEKKLISYAALKLDTEADRAVFVRVQATGADGVTKAYDF